MGNTYQIMQQEPEFVSPPVKRDLKSFIRPRRKPLRFSDRDKRHVPCLGLGEGGSGTVDRIEVDAVYCLYDEDSLQLKAEGVLLLQRASHLVSQVPASGSDRGCSRTLAADHC